MLFTYIRLSHASHEKMASSMKLLKGYSLFQFSSHNNFFINQAKNWKQISSVVYQRPKFSAENEHFQLSVSAAEYKGWVWPNVKFLFSTLVVSIFAKEKQIDRQIILDQKLYLLNLMRIQKKKLPYGSFFAKSNKEKNKAVCKVPPYFYIYCTFGFGFGIPPKARCFSGQIFNFDLKWNPYFQSFTGKIIVIENFKENTGVKV